MTSKALPLVAMLLVSLILTSLSGCQPAAQSDDDTHALSGQPAPHFSTTYLDGSPFELANQTNSKVVVLDFWATWCGPCRAAMPTLSEVTNQFRDRGVEFYAVNCAEQPPVVQSFLEQSGLELTVIMDPDGSISKAYGVEGIPQTVLIDRQGKVRFVHVGLSPNLRAKLTAELTELTAEASAAPTAAQTPKPAATQTTIR